MVTLPSSRVKPFLAQLFILAVTLVLAACGGDKSANKSPQPSADPAEKATLVVSIGPLAMIAREIAGEQVAVRPLIGNGDPHHYAPSVTDRVAMESAQLVVWLGPQMESVLARQMALLPEQQQLGLLAAGGYEFDRADKDDPHLWLRPRNAAVMAAHIANRLAALNPGQAQEFRARARDFSRAMANLQKVQDRALWAYRDVQIVSTHKAYSQFFGPAGVTVNSLSGSSSHQHGARAMLEHRENTEAEAGRGCLFGEVPVNERDRQTAEHLNLGYQALDPLGTQLPADATYPQLMQQLLADARECLGAIPDRSAEH